MVWRAVWRRQALLLVLAVNVEWEQILSRNDWVHFLSRRLSSAAGQTGAFLGPLSPRSNSMDHLTSFLSDFHMQRP